MKHLNEKMYPKVKVREQIEEDESPHSVVRIPGSYVPTSPTPSFIPSKEETNKKKWTIWGKNQKNERATSAPRVRAILSSPENDRISRSKTQVRRELLSALKSHNSCQNRHAKCKVFFSRMSQDAEVFEPGIN